MTFSVVCPSCDKRLQVKDTVAGKRIKCPACLKVITVTLHGTTTTAPATQKTVAPRPERASETQPFLAYRLKRATQQFLFAFLSLALTGLMFAGALYQPFGLGIGIGVPGGILGLLVSFGLAIAGVMTLVHNPVPGKTVEVTFKQYLSVTACGSMWTSLLDGYACLEPNTNRRFPTIKRFANYWKQFSEKLSNDIKRSLDVTRVSWNREVVSVKVNEADDQSTATAVAKIRLRVTGARGGAHKAAVFVLKLEGELIKEGEYWYVVDGHWDLTALKLKQES